MILQTGFTFGIREDVDPSVRIGGIGHMLNFRNNGTR